MWDSAYVAPTFLGLTLVRFMETLYEDNAHVQMVVPGVGHSSRSMWLSGVGKTALFGN